MEITAHSLSHAKLPKPPTLHSKASFLASTSLPFQSSSKSFFAHASQAQSPPTHVAERWLLEPVDGKSQELGRKTSMVSSALPETAASVAIAATIVGAAATLLVRRTKASEVTELHLEVCGDCAGSGICSECNGEGFVLKKLSEESAEKARMAAKTMATRYTAGLPKKWSYCTKCSSSRSCSTCGGRGKLSY